MPLVYFAHPIDFVLEGFEASFRADCDLVVGQLAGAGHVVFDPGTAWSFDAATPVHQRLQAGNLKVLAEADVVVAYLPAGVQTIGTVLEMVEAANLGIPVVVIVTKLSVALAGYEPDLIYQFTGVATAVEALPAIVERHRRPQKVRLAPDVEFSGQVVTWSGGEIQEAVSTTAYVKLGDGASPPRRSHDDDAGFDLYYSGDRAITIPAMGAADVPSNVAMEWPPGVWALLIGRSSTFRSRGLLVNPAVIDPGYRGDLFAIVRNIGPNAVEIRPGERIAQLVPLPALAPDIEIERVEELTPTERGANGLGSTGR